MRYSRRPGARAAAENPVESAYGAPCGVSSGGEFQTFSVSRARSRPPAFSGSVLEIAAITLGVGGEEEEGYFPV